jgi:heme ABC exporter ATP-binding subunit CcmA
VTDKPLLRVSGLRKGYGGPPVLRGIDLTLERGDGLALLGPNGAGKSTLLRLLAGLHKPQEGRVELAGEPFRPDDPDHRRSLGFVSHESLLYGGLSARENLRFTGALFGLDRVEERITAGLQEVGLEWVGERPVRAFSRGMTQRLTLARALLHRPRLLLLDEPMTGLDPAGIRSLELLLVRFREAAGAILMTTHDLSHVVPVATRVAFLKQGRIIDGGGIDRFPGRALDDRYHELFPAALAGRGSGTGDRTPDRGTRPTGGSGGRPA